MTGQYQNIASGGLLKKHAHKSLQFSVFIHRGTCYGCTRKEVVFADNRTAINRMELHVAMYAQTQFADEITM